MNILATPEKWHLVLCILISSGANGRPQDNLQDVDTDMPGPPEEDDFANCDPPYFGNEEAQTVPENFVRMGPNSKYFIGLTSIVEVDEVAQFCEGIGLQSAEIRNHLELLSIDSFLEVNASPDTLISLGLNDQAKEGSFVETDGVTPMVFHAFAEGQPNNDLNIESCVVLKRHPSFNKYVYFDTVCDTGVTPMCMFKIGTRCYYSSPLSTVPLSSGFAPLGSSDGRDYFVSVKQLPREMAAGECNKAGGHLVDFNTGIGKSQLLYEMIKSWIQKNGIFPRIPFWTGAKLIEKNVEGSEPVYEFAVLGGNPGDLSEWPALVWDFGEPSDSSNLGLEQCISVILYLLHMPNQDNIYTLATTNCRLPHYALCYKDTPLITDSENSTEAQIPDNGNNSTTEDPNEVTTPLSCPTSANTLKFDLNNPGFTQEETLELSRLSRTGVLGSEFQRFKLDNEKPWLTDFIEVVFSITRKVAPMSLVPPEFLNSMHNMLLLYYNSVLDKVVEPQENSLKMVKAETVFLKKCEKTLKPLELGTLGGKPTAFKDLPVAPVRESVTFTYPVLDVVIDSFWYSFLTSIGSCYAEAPPSRTQWLSNIHNIFIKNFISVFDARWKQLANLPNFGVILGDLDFVASRYSLQVVAVSAFINNNIHELYFPRPLVKQERGLLESLNTKIVQILGD